jgi:pimeloyl-ACP methyl ester carboxylesterase
MTLQDGRILGYAEWGDADGEPVFHFHGSGSSRLERPPDPAMLSGARLITVDRPGHGLSDFQPKRQLLDWLDDVTALADHLGLDRFAVAGASFGGPYAMTCAHGIPDRLTAVGLISSFAPYDQRATSEGRAGAVRFALGAARRAPWLGTLFMGMQARMIRGDPERLGRQMFASAPDSDKELFEQPQVLDILLETVREGMRSGGQGAAWDATIMVRPWGFLLQDITCPVQIWHGEADTNNPLTCGEYLRDTIPNSHATFLPGEGHLFYYKRWGDILAALVD